MALSPVNEDFMMGTVNHHSMIFDLSMKSIFNLAAVAAGRGCLLSCCISFLGFDNGRISISHTLLFQNYGNGVKDASVIVQHDHVVLGAHKLPTNITRCLR